MGPDATVERLKAYKVASLSGKVPQTKTWISLKSDGRPKGPIGFLWSKHLKLSWRLNILQVLISNVKSKVLTDKQWFKFINSAQSPQRDLSSDSLSVVGYRDMPQVLKRFGRLFKQTIVKAKYDPPTKWVNSPTQKSLIPSRIGQYTRVVENFATIGDHLYWLEELCFPLVDNPHASIIQHYIEATGIEDTYSSEWSSENELLSGTVSVIQERGMKARIIANPLRVHQMVLSKLGNYLFAIVRNLPWDCTYDQSKGVNFIQNHLCSGGTVFCHDLSDATNNFPLEFSIMLLNFIKEILPLEERGWFAEHIELFTLIARGRWLAPVGLPDKLRHNLTEDQFVVWTNGQPLGLYPSFPLFALSHGFLIRLIEYRLGKMDTFRVLGDDVVITDYEVSETYLRHLKTLGVPISEEKSLISNELGEFAGRIVSKRGPLNVEKWKIGAESTYLEYVRWLGKPGLQLVPRKLRQYVWTLACIPKPLGLGLNPLGLTFNQRIPECFEIDYIMSTEETTALPSVREDRKEERVLGIKRALNMFLKFLDISTTYGLPPDRHDQVDPVMVDHLNSLRNYYGHIPDVFMKEWKNIRDLTFRRTRYITTGVSIGRFYRFYRKWKRNL